ncbi:MAG: MarR family winged helix-turn-helix transcriptional regulator [Microbacter sp.]
MNCIYTLKNINKVINQCEKEFASKYGLTLNEAIVLCSLDGKTLCASEIAETSNLQCSQTSKILKSLEDKNLIERTLGKTDKRNMFFLLSTKGQTILQAIKAYQPEMPEGVKALFF